MWSRRFGSKRDRNLITIIVIFEKKDELTENSYGDLFFLNCKSDYIYYRYSVEIAGGLGPSAGKVKKNPTTLL